MSSSGQAPSPVHSFVEWRLSSANAASLCNPEWVPEIDPSDDGRLRYVVMHYGFDEQSHERTPRVVAAFDNEAEYREYATAAVGDLKRRQQAGLADSKESITGVQWPAGHHAREQSKRLVRRAVAHGAAVPSELVDELDNVRRATKP